MGGRLASQLARGKQGPAANAAVPLGREAARDGRQGRALKSLADRQALEHAMVQGCGGVHLDFSYPQLATLQRGNC